MIYLDNAATTLKKSQIVIDAVVDAMNSLGNSGRGAYKSSLDASRNIFKTRLKISEFFGVSSPLNVAFTKNATEASNAIIEAIFTPSDAVITTVMEHNAILRPLYRLEDMGLKIDFLESDLKGNLNYDDLHNLLRENTKAVICTHASNLTGNITNLKKISKFCKENNLLFIVDASQTAGVIPINMEEMNIDILVFTGHKSLMGPQGTGGICINTDIPLKPFIVGGNGIRSYEKYQPTEMPTIFEAGTLNGHGISGLCAAIEYIEENKIENLYKTKNQLMMEFYNGVKNLENIKILGDFEAEYRTPIVSLNIGDLDSSYISDELFTKYEIATRPGAHCAPLAHKALNTVSQGAVRFSFSSFNTSEEIKIAIDAVKELSKLS